MRVIQNRRPPLAIRAHQIPSRFTEALAKKTREGMPASAALIGLWIAGQSMEAMPVSTSLRRIAEDTGCNRLTIHKALDWLKSESLISVEEGAVLRAGHRALSITLQ
jgi:DNA-binding transcriptional MocR family regulator